jgi:hypothetical protein
MSNLMRILKAFHINTKNLRIPITTEDTESIDKNVPMKTMPAHSRNMHAHIQAILQSSYIKSLRKRLSVYYTKCSDSFNVIGKHPAKVGNPLYFLLPQYTH